MCSLQRALWHLCLLSALEQQSRAESVQTCAGTESVTQVPVHWGIHEDVYCAVRPALIVLALSQNSFACHPCRLVLRS